LTFSCGLNTKNTRLPINISIRFYEEIIALVNKTLSYLSDLLFRWITIFQEFDVFAASYLLFSLDPLIILDKADFVRVDKGVIFADFAE
jgi:hypothetical protein